MGGLLAPLKLAQYRRLAAAYAVNDLGDMVGSVALAILIFDRTQSALATTALFVAAKFFPALVAPAIVARVDNLPTGRTLGVVHIVEAGLFVCLAGLVGSFWLPAVLILGFLDGTLALVGRSLLRASVANLLEPRGLLREGNAVFNVIFAVCTAAGPALAGVLIAWKGVTAALLLDAVSFAVIAALLVTAPGLSSGRVDDESWVQRLRNGIGWVRSNPRLRVLLGAQAGALLFFASVVPIEVVYVKETLDGGDAGFGLLLSSWGVGVVCGAAVFAVLRRMSLPVVIAASTLAIGVSYAGQAIAPTLAAACVAAVIGGLGNGIQTVAVLTAIQERTPSELQARVMGIFESLGAAVPGVGFILGGVLAAVFDPRVAFAVAAAGVGAVVIATVLLLVRRPETPEEALASQSVEEHAVAR